MCLFLVARPAPKEVNPKSPDNNTDRSAYVNRNSVSVSFFWDTGIESGWLETEDIKT